MDKKELRAMIARKKLEAAQSALFDLSGPILRRLVAHPRFSAARTVLLYHSLPDEVDTHQFVRYWSNRKKILLPSVRGEELELHCYHGDDSLEKGAFGIEESTGEVFTDYDSIDLAIVPGLSFDSRGNRLGRGRGFYDRLLAQFKGSHTYIIGICFDFQKVGHVPVDEHDIPVDEVL